MISKKKIFNSFSDTSESSRTSTLPRSDFEGDFVKIFDNKNFLSDLTSIESMNPLVKKDLTKCESSLQKRTLERGNNKKQGLGNASSSSSSQHEKITKTSKHLNNISTCKIGDLRINTGQDIFSNVKNNKQFNEGGRSAASFSTDCDSTGSFLSNKSQGENGSFVKVRDNLSEYSKPLRLFNKSGKPLTDQAGRPLINILGEKLVVFDDKGKVISDSKGNQVFNSLGESAIYPTTNLYIPPSEEEPGIPLLDIDKQHILFLFDNKGHPLTDSFGRPLLCASGNPMIGMRPKVKLNLDSYEHYKLKNMYSMKPLETLMRFVQIFDSDAKPLTDDCGNLLEGAKVICNKNGMPMCDGKGRPVYFKSGKEISIPGEDQEQKKEMGKIELIMMETSKNSLVHQNIDSPLELDQQIFEGNTRMKNIVFSERCLSDGLIKYSDENSNQDSNEDDNACGNESPNFVNKNKNTHSCIEIDNNQVQLDKPQGNENIDVGDEKMSSGLKEDNVFPTEECMDDQCRDFLPQNVAEKRSENEANIELNHKTNCNKHSTETVFLFNAAEKVDNRENSPVNVAHFEAVKGRQSRHKRKPPKQMYSLNFFQYFKDTFSKPCENQGVEQFNYNEYGKPLKDIHGNSLYDKYGIPLTGAQGRRLSEGARRALRSRLRNVPKNRANITAEETFPPLCNSESHDQFGEPVYDKYGRPLYDLAGRLIYDRFGRPLTDAFGRPLVDAIGQPLMDCEGRVLTSAYDSDSNMKLVDIFGRKIYDKHGRPLFDSYGRPKYDIFTYAIYDSCGRPATDANGNILFDFLNKPIKPHPGKPIYKNARARLPKYIDTILTVPSMYRVLKYSQPLEDVFGGPLFDDLGRPLYNKIGKPLFDRYGRPLYNKSGTPLCDCYGRPLSEDIKQSDDDPTLSVVDCLKLLKVTEESSKWMISQNKVLKSKNTEEVNKNTLMKISYKKKCNKKTGQYVYTLTRVTKFASGHQALEILEAPLSPSTVAEMHRLPVDNKPLMMIVGQRQKQEVKQQ